MEGVKSRSESPFSRSKGKNHAASENGNKTVDQVKTRKKNLRNKNKHQINGKETEDIGSNGQDFCEEEQVTSNEVDDNVDSNNTEREDETARVSNFENGNRHNEKSETNDNKENDASSTVSEVKEEVSAGETLDKPKADAGMEEFENTEDDINVDEDSSDKCYNTSKTETESSAKKEVVESHDSLPEVASEISEEKCNQEANDTVEIETNGLTPEKEPVEEASAEKAACQAEVNGSDASLNYEEVNKAEDPIQASPDTVTKDDLSIPSKITNFFGKFTYSTEQKQDSEISSSKKTEKTGLSHPYLSKVSGRRGIKERLNSSATVFNSTEHEAKTPENSGVSLDDSFRVRTNPPRLSSMDLNENPTLRKFKGKRCLNAGDEPEEEEGVYLGSSKRRKLDEKTQESGILGSILWSPFKKRALENENQLKLTTTESKLSRLLSPFWFWKRATEGQKRE